MLNLNTLYYEYAEHYNIIANDRDFEAECEVMFAPKQDEDSIVYYELFSGPAYHARIINELKNVSVYAFDNSKRMQELATQAGLPQENYVVDVLPDALLNSDGRPRPDIISAVRYSLGLLGTDDIKQLLKYSHDVLNDNGYMVIECHQQELITQRFNNLEIRRREKRIDKNTVIYCEWPSAAIKFNEQDKTASMPIKVEKYIDDKCVSSYCAESVETLIDVNTVMKYAREAGFSKTHMSSNNTCFKQSSLVFLHK